MTIADRRSGSQWKRDTEVLSGVDSQGIIDWMQRLLKRTA
jgi:hypothetical protein